MGGRNHEIGNFSVNIPYRNRRKFRGRNGRRWPARSEGANRPWAVGIGSRLRRICWPNRPMTRFWSKA